MEKTFETSASFIQSSNVCIALKGFYFFISCSKPQNEDPGLRFGFTHSHYGVHDKKT